jgi:hypothetical protein
LDHRLDALAVAILEQAAERDAAPGRLGLVVEQVVELMGVIPKSAQDFGSQFGVEVLFILTLRTKPQDSSYDLTE